MSGTPNERSRPGICYWVTIGIVRTAAIQSNLCSLRFITRAFDNLVRTGVGNRGRILELELVCSHIDSAANDAGLTVQIRLVRVEWVIRVAGVYAGRIRQQVIITKTAHTILIKLLDFFSRQSPIENYDVVDSAVEVICMWIAAKHNGSYF